MGKTRIEAFSDGVIAIIITIMVLELKVPHGTDWAALQPLWPVFLSYLLSFVNVGIYWNNHHHMFQAVKQASGAVLWANLHLLFWLSLIPFTTAYMGENEFAAIPVAIYAFDMLMCAIAYAILALRLTAHHGRDSDFARALGTNRKSQISLATYVVAIPLAFLNQRLALALIAMVAALWFIPDRRFERS